MLDKSYSAVGYEDFNAKYKFTAQEDDDTTGLYYYNARFYDPEIGRFITPDSMVPDPTNTQHYNRYMYCSGNPVKYNDPTGNMGEGPTDNVTNDISLTYGDDNGRTESADSSNANQDPIAKDIYDIACWGEDLDPAFCNCRPEKPAAPDIRSADNVPDASQGVSYPGKVTAGIIGNTGTQPAYFTQGQFNSVDNQFGGKGCAAVSLVNELSEEYTEQTGKELTFEMAKKMLEAAIAIKSIDKSKGLLVTWEKAANTMWGKTELSGKWAYNQKSKDHVIYDIKENSKSTHHFVNSSGQNKCFDVANGKNGKVNALSLNPAWQTRNLIFSR